MNAYGWVKWVAGNPYQRKTVPRLGHWDPAMADVLCSVVALAGMGWGCGWGWGGNGDGDCGLGGQGQ